MSGGNRSGMDTLKAVKSACKRAFAGVAVFSFGVNVLMLMVPVYMMQLFDRVITTQNINTLVMLTAIAAVALVTLALLDGVRGVVATRASLWLDRTLGPPVLEAIVNDSLRKGQRGSTQALRDIMVIRNFLGGSSVFPLFDAPWAPVFLLVTFLLHPLLGIVASVGVVIILIVAVANEALTRKPTKEAGAIQGRAYYDADSTIRNADVIAALGMLPAVTRRWSQATNAGLKRQASASQFAIVLLAAAKSVRLFLQISVLACGAYLVVNSEITPGTMIATSVLMNRAVAPIEQAIGTWRSLLSAWFAYGRVKQMLDQEDVHHSTTKMPVPKGSLTVQNLTWVPPSRSEPVLRNIGFALEPGEALGVIGPSAAGKTSLVRQIVGSLTPTGGSVQLDGAEISVWDSVDRGQYVGYLPQDVELFDGTVKQNIARFSDLPDQEIVEAAQSVGAHEIILKLPLGYDTLIGGNGVPLSGGQRQRIGLARAMVGRPKLVVLDEPNAHLDSDGERALADLLRSLKRSGTTVVMVVQRFAGLREMDKLLLLRDGRAVDFGPRDRILADVGRKLRFNETLPATAGASIEAG